MRLLELRRNPDKNKREHAFDILNRYEGRGDVFVSFVSDVGVKSHSLFPMQFDTTLDDPDGNPIEMRVFFANDKNGKRFVNHVEPRDGSNLLGHERAAYKDQAEDRFQYLLGRKDRNIAGGKIGINPRSDYNTPIGIYCYPVDYILRLFHEQSTITPLPPFPPPESWTYFYVMQATVDKAQILDVKSVTPDQVTTFVDRLREILKDTHNEESFNRVLNAAFAEAKGHTNAFKLWNALRLFAGQLSTMRLADGKNASKAAVIWTALMREAGLRAVVDHGEGVIHSNEPTQAVFLDKTALRVLEMGSKQSMSMDGAIKIIEREQPASQIATAQAITTIASQASNTYLTIKDFEQKLQRALAIITDARLRDVVLSSLASLFRHNERLIPIVKTMSQHDRDIVLRPFFITHHWMVEILMKNDVEISNDLLMAALNNGGDHIVSYVLERRPKIRLDGADVVRVLRQNRMKDHLWRGDQEYWEIIIKQTDFTPTDAAKAALLAPNFLSVLPYRTIPPKTLLRAMVLAPDLRSEIRNDPTIRKIIVAAVAQNPNVLTMGEIFADPDLPLFLARMDPANTPGTLVLAARREMAAVPQEVYKIGAQNDPNFLTIAPEWFTYPTMKRFIDRFGVPDDMNWLRFHLTRAEKVKLQIFAAKKKVDARYLTPICIEVLEHLPDNVRPTAVSHYGIDWGAYSLKDVLDFFPKNEHSIVFHRFVTDRSRSRVVRTTTLDEIVLITSEAPDVVIGKVLTLDYEANGSRWLNLLMLQDKFAEYCLAHNRADILDAFVKAGLSIVTINFLAACEALIPGKIGLQKAGRLKIEATETHAVSAKPVSQHAVEFLNTNVRAILPRAMSDLWPREIMEMFVKTATEGEIRTFFQDVALVRPETTMGIFAKHDARHLFDWIDHSPNTDTKRQATRFVLRNPTVLDDPVILKGLVERGIEVPDKYAIEWEKTFGPS